MSQLFDQHLSVKPNGHLFHYTSASGIMGIFHTKTIWATNVFYLNDHAEFLFALDLVNRNLEARRSQSSETEHPFLDELQKRVALFNQPFGLYVASFSEAGNLLSQWRAYSGDGVGFCIGFYWERLSTLAKSQGFTLARCVYDPGFQQTLVDQLVHDSLNEVKEKWDGKSASIPGISFVSRLAQIAPLLKHPSFSEEKEWRLFTPIRDPGQIEISFRQNKWRLIPYSEFRLTDSQEPVRVGPILVGPCPDPFLNMTATVQLLQTSGVLYDDVRQSGIPFRSW